MAEILERPAEVTGEAAKQMAEAIFSNRFEPLSAAVAEEGGDEEITPEIVAEPENKAEGQPKEVVVPADGTDNPLLKAIKGELPEPEVVPEEVKSWLKNKGFEDHSEIDSIKAQKLELESKLKELQEDVAYLETLSEEAKNVIAMDKEGKDWKKEVLSRPTLDWRLTFDKQDKKTLLDTYAKGKVSEEDWEEYNSEDPDPSTKRFVDAVIEGLQPKYDKDRTDVTTYRERSAQEQNQMREKFEGSLNNSMQHVFASVPGSKAYEGQIKEAIMGLRDLFYEKDGVTLKPTAALDAWFVTQRPAIMAAKEAKLRTEAQNAATVSTLRRTEEKKHIPKGNVAGGGEKTAEQVAKEIMASRLPTAR